MRHYLKDFWFVVLILMLQACASGVGGGSNEPTPNISLSQTNVDFSGVVLDNSADQPVAITNTGNADLVIGQIPTPSAPVSIVSDTCSNATLAPSGTCAVCVRFAPIDQGQVNTTLSIPSNDPDAATVNMNVRGEGQGLNAWINNIDCTECLVNHTIQVNVTITDTRSNVLLNELDSANFTLATDGDPIVDFTVDTIEYPSPVSLALALDWSGSTTNVRSEIQAAAIALINQLSTGDYAALCKFNEVVDFYPQSDASDLFIAGDSDGKSSLTTYINTAFSSGTSTFLYDVLTQAIERAAQGTNTKKAVIVLSDGIDEGSTATLDQVVTYAGLNQIPIFTIFCIDPSYEGSGYTAIMQRLANATGGQYYNSDTDDLESIFLRIANTLSNKYTLHFTSTTCTGTLDVGADWNGLYGQDSLSFP